MDVWQRAAAVSAIVPIVGCGFHFLADADKTGWKPPSDWESVSTALCITGDVLIVSEVGAALGAAIEAILAGVQFLIGYFHVETPAVDAVLQERNRVWNDNWVKSMYRFLYSDPHLYPDKGFRHALQDSLAIETLAMQNMAADAIGLLEAASQQAAASTQSNENRTELQQGANNTLGLVRAHLSSEIIRRERQALLKLVSNTVSGSSLSFEATSKQFNSEFSKLLQPKPLPWWRKLVRWLDPVEAIASAIKGLLTEDAWYKLRDQVMQTPVPVPGHLDVAYVIGQTYDIDLDKSTLSPYDYLKGFNKTKSLGHYDLNDIIIKQSMDVISVLQHRITENPYSFHSSIQDFDSYADLWVLIAMRYGQLYAMGIATNNETAARVRGEPSTPPINAGMDPAKAARLIFEHK
ncbi:hypothetical protein CDD80_2420 [Ophiocordyceps camponoti-rufipedis]|uniref:Uncharacterized protein n=1 Tax=Ophiocordyceps camponoti-rufipedis TaxID=2004952 RepID=A0A2C5XX06_9HYPO|nr:hypothetical protein CDD80_2420 [Ophiocordyceps camponoti-rufipedis]